MTVLNIFFVIVNKKKEYMAVNFILHVFMNGSGQ